MKIFVSFLFFLSLLAGTASADIGVLIPGGRQEPDSSVLTLQEIRIQVKIDHQHARVKILQIFANHTNLNQEGKYVFAIPGDAAISDFAVWDGPVRIPGVILERKRASEIYESLQLQQIDPGLLQQEEGAEGPRMAGVFSARIAPIPPFGTKRLEMEYTQRVSVEGLKSHFSVPLKPDLYRNQTSAFFSISLEILSQAPITDFRSISSKYPLQLRRQSPQEVTGSFESSSIELTEDFAVQYSLGVKASELQFLPYRGDESSLRKSEQPASPLQAPSTKKQEDGYFWLSALFNERVNQLEENQAPRSILILLDTSSSMRWEKLEQAYRALEYFLSRLRESDEFLLSIFHQEVKSHASTFVAAGKANTDTALQFVKEQYLMGGTDFQKALSQATAAASGMKNKERYLILLTDGNPTLTEIRSKQLLSDFSTANSNSALRVFSFGIGADSNRTLLSGLSEQSNGFFDWTRETEDLSFKLQAFFSKIGQLPLSGLALQTSDSSLLYHVYPAEPARVYDGSAIDWFGRYQRPAPSIELSVSGSMETMPVELRKTVTFPDVSTLHDFIPRGWACKRVDALLQKIELEGEDQAAIDEIIALSKKYKFVTPYTSFLAAPRSLLRPRVIRPGDPILRIKTDPDITSVVAIFPFGLIKRLQYLNTEDIWQTRFLVPKEMKDGSYDCRIILRDRYGNQYEETKSFLVDSMPPQFRARWEGEFRPGGQIKIVVSADKDTRTILAGLQTLAPVRVEWSARDRACVGYLKLPADLPAGVYELRVTGEDFAHNQTLWTRKVEVH